MSRNYKVRRLTAGLASLAFVRAFLTKRCPQQKDAARDMGRFSIVPRLPPSLELRREWQFCQASDPCQGRLKLTYTSLDRILWRQVAWRQPRKFVNPTSKEQPQCLRKSGENLDIFWARCSAKPEISVIYLPFIFASKASLLRPTSMVENLGEAWVNPCQR